MRVTGGSLRGRIVEAKKGAEGVRPAMDRMRESVFAVLGDLQGKSFLDLFSGSGIIGLEAASRGASPVVCVEKDAQKRSTLIKNLSIAPERIEVRIFPVELYLMRTKEAFDIAFCDPPFPYRFRAELCQRVAEGGAVKPGGLFLIHRPDEDPLPESFGPLARVDQRTYGRSIVEFYEKRE